MRWLMRLLRRKRLERDLERELRFHLEAHTRDLMRSGWSRAAAEREAQRALGGVDQVKEAARDTRGTRWLEDWWYDSRFAVRALRRTPVFTAAAVLTLALGIGANTAVWSIVDALIIRTLPIERPTELHALRRNGIEDDNYRMSFTRFRQLQAELPAGTSLAAMSSLARAYATVGDRPEAVTLQLVSGEWFSLLGAGAARGRLIGPQDAQAVSAHPVVVLSDGYWSRQFGRDPRVVGSSLRVNGAVLTVIGIAEPGFAGLTVGQAVDAWVPLVMQHEVKYRTDAASHNADADLPWVPQDGIEWLTLLTRVPSDGAARLQPLLDSRFRAELARTVADRDEQERAHALREHVVLEPIERGFSPLRSHFGDGLRVLMITVAFVLLIACGNLAGLLLARGAARTHEFAVRVSLGARPGRLVRQVLCECMVLALIGGTLGLLVAHWGSSALLRAASTGPRVIPLDIGLDVRVLAFTFLISLTTGLLCGFALALRVARSRADDAFRSGDRVSGGRGWQRLPLGRVLIASQMALSLVLVILSGLFVRTFRNLVTVDPGYEAEHIVTAWVDVRAAGYEPERLPALYQRLREEVAAVPGVGSASLSAHGLAGGLRRISGFTVPGRSLEPGDRQGQEVSVTPGFFATTGMVLLRGRDFTDADRADAPSVAVISETAAQHFFGSIDVVGARFGYGEPAEFEVVGVVRDARVNNLREPLQRLIYYPLAQQPDEYITSVEARVALPGAAVIDAIRNAIAGVDARLPVREVVVLRDLLHRTLWRERLIARIAALFGAIALLLAAIGLYGVMAYTVSRRTSELGIRLALGARPAHVRGLVLRDSLVTVAAGVALGLTLSFAVVDLTRGLLFGLSPHDPATTVTAVVLTVVAAIVAAFLPAWRAARVDPLLAMRAE